MKRLTSALFLAILAGAWQSGSTQEQRNPSVGFAQGGNTAGLVDTDLFDEQKYEEQAGGDLSAAKAKRAAHEQALTKEFFNGYNSAKECDGVMFTGKNGDQKPEFTLQIMVDTHDTVGQKPTWVWVLTDTASKKYITKGEDDTSAIAAKNICLAVFEAAKEKENPRAAQNKKATSKP